MFHGMFHATYHQCFTECFTKCSTNVSRRAKQSWRAVLILLRISSEPWVEEKLLHHNEVYESEKQGGITAGLNS